MPMQMMPNNQGFQQQQFIAKPCPRGFTCFRQGKCNDLHDPSDFELNKTYKAASKLIKEAGLVCAILMHHDVKLLGFENLPIRIKN